MTPDDAAREGLLTSRAAYGARAAEYTELLGTMDAVAEDDRLLVEAWADRVDGVLADVGCGPAHWTAHLASLGHEVTGIEPVEEFVTHAHRTHPEVRVKPGSFQTLPVAAFNGIPVSYTHLTLPTILLV